MILDLVTSQPTVLLQPFQCTLNKDNSPLPPPEIAGVILKIKVHKQDIKNKRTIG